MMVLVTYSNTAEGKSRNVMFVCETKEKALEELQPWLTGKKVSYRGMGTSLMVIIDMYYEEFYLLQEVEVR